MTSPSERPDPALTPVAELLADLPGTDPGTLAPPPQLRARLFQQIRATAAEAPLPTRDQLPAAARPYRDQVAAVDGLLTALPPAGWRIAVVNGWDTLQVLGHLLAVDALAAACLGLPTPAQTGTGETVEQRTASVHLALPGSEPAAWQRVWRGQAVALLRHTAAVGERGLTRQVGYLGRSFSAGDVLLDRGFETWVHGEDLREKLDAGSLPIEPDDAFRLADLGLRMLPLAWSASGAPARTGTLDVELTGDGGGRWQLLPDGTVRSTGSLPSPARGRRPTLRLDVMEFCALAGGRRAAAEAAHASDGPADLVAGALTAVAALARL
jgi:hypothetical protein